MKTAVQERLLTPGGILATEYQTGEQWDKPNGWAPLQWMAIQGFKRYGHDDLADDIARRWLKTVNHVYRSHHKLIEKYHIADAMPHEGGGGEYPLQDGFGWTQRRGTAADWLIRRAIIKISGAAGLPRRLFYSPALSLPLYKKWHNRQ
jgi:neutral trehalase